MKRSSSLNDNYSQSHQKSTTNQASGSSSYESPSTMKQSKPSSPPQQKSDPPFDYFLSDPSCSEEEDVSNSHADMQRKLLYMRRRQGCANAHRTAGNNNNEWDAASVGNTSLSSSNISPMPRFRIQFDGSSETSGLGFISEDGADGCWSNANNKQTEDGNGTNLNALGDRMKKFRAASSLPIRLPFGRMNSEASESSIDDHKYAGGKKNTSISGNTTSLIGGEDIMEAALMPPSTDGCGELNSAYTRQSGDYAAKYTQAIEPPQMDADYSLSTAQTSSLRGTDIVTEQAGGESSSSVAISSLESPSSITHETGDKRPSETNNNISSNNQTTRKEEAVNTSSSPSKQSKRKKRLRFSKSNQQTPTHSHRRQRSGDHMAAGILIEKTQQEFDWIGMKMSGFVVDDADESTNVNEGNGASPAYGSIDSVNPFSASEAFSQESPVESLSSSPSHDHQRMWRSLPNASAFPSETLPRQSSHLSFSDSSGQKNNSPPRVRLQPHLYQQGHPQHSHQYHQQQQWQQAQYQSRQHSNSGSGYDQGLCFAPNRMDHYNYNQRLHTSWDPSRSWIGGNNRPSEYDMMRMSGHLSDNAFRSSLGSARPPNSFRGVSQYSFRGVSDISDNDFRGSLRNDMYNHLGNTPRDSSSGSIGSTGGIKRSSRMETHPIARIQESDSSGSSASTASSSLDDEDDNSSLIRARADEFQRLKANHQAARRQDMVKFDRVMKRVTSVLETPLFREPKLNEQTSEEMKPPPTFYCPNCRTRQRAFYDVTTAAGQFESPLGYLVVYFALYLLSVLFVFGLEEGWTPLDCVYFAVITLTTAGLGDFVPSSDGAKLICACFIYFGVATIGLLLGSLLAGSLDDASKKDLHDSLVRDCPNCLRLEKLKMRRIGNQDSNLNNGYNAMPVQFERVNKPFSNPSSSTNDEEEGQNIGLDLNDSDHNGPPTSTPTKPRVKSPTRQHHTKHMSLSFDASKAKEFFNDIKHARRRSADFKTIDENSPFLDRSSSSYVEHTQHPFESKPAYDETSTSTTSSSESSSNLAKPMSRLKAVKYIVLTLNKALLNSLLIIFVGSAGFFFIEGMSLVDSFYFTTVLLTTVGYGDIVPVSDAGKVFTTVYVIVAGTILLHNMSLISMIPLQLRKRRIEQTVLGQFGSQLTDDELQELSTGRLIQRLKLATNRPDGLDECTREMFSLAMLVRLGRITEEDVKATFAAFRRLDIGNYGTLNSRTVIEGEIWRIRSCKNLTAMSAPQNLSPLRRSYSADSLELASHQASVHYNPYSYVVQSPNTFMNPISNDISQGSLRRLHSADNSHISETGFDFDAYDRWSRGFHHYDSPRAPDQ